MKPQIYFWSLILLVGACITACARPLLVTPNPAALLTRTPTRTATFTATITSTLTATSTSTATSSLTSTAVSTSTSTATQTPTDTATSTATQTLTDTQVDTATDTPTNTFTDTPTATFTAVPGAGWIEATSNAGFARVYPGLLDFNGAMWEIAGAGAGFFNDVWSTTDGTNWTQVTPAAAFPARYWGAVVVYNGAMWLVGGTTNGTTFINDVWTSTDGANWTQVLANGPASPTQFSPRVGHTLVVYNNAMWLIGGWDGGSTEYNDVWTSTDGATWTQVLAPGPASSTQFSGRDSHTSVVFNNAMWVIGGFDVAEANDVWSSTDGITWSQATAAAAFPPRYSHSSVVYNGSMWVMGGAGAALYNDVWSSTDGVNWTPVLAAGPSSSTQFSARYIQGALVYNGSMWVMGGYDGSVLGDVWHSP